MNKYCRKLFAAFLPFTLSATCLTGCDLFDDGSRVRVDEVIEQKASDIGADGVTLRLMTCSNWMLDGELALAEEFEVYTGIHIEFEEEPAEGYQDKVIEKLTLDDTPDIFMLQSGFALATTYQIDDRAVDLSDEIWVDKYSTFSREMCSIDDKIYGMTYCDTTTDYDLVYNKKLLKAAGVEEIPKDFKQFDDMCRQIKKSGVTPIYEPVSDGWHHTLLWADMGQVFEKINPGIVDKLNSNQLRFQDDPYMLKAMTQINSLAQKGYFGDSYITDTFDDAESYMASGEYAMCMLKSGSIKGIVENDMNAGYEEKDFGIMLFPVCDNTYLNVHPTGPTRFISNKSENIEAAKLYFEFLASKDSIQYMIDNDMQVENMPFDYGQEPGYSKACSEFMSQFSEATSGDVLQDDVKYFNEQWDEISFDMAEMFRGRMSPLEVLIEVDKRRAKLARNAGDENW